MVRLVIFSDTDSLKSFINDEEVQTNPSFYCDFTNVEVDIEQTLGEVYNKAVNDLENYDEISNLCESSEEELETDDFIKSKDNIVNYHKNLFPKTNNDQEKEHNQLARAVLYSLRFDKTNEKNICNK